MVLVVDDSCYYEESRLEMPVLYLRLSKSLRYMLTNRVLIGHLPGQSVGRTIDYW